MRRMDIPTGECSPRRRTNARDSCRFLRRTHPPRLGRIDPVPRGISTGAGGIRRQSSFLVLPLSSSALSTQCYCCGVSSCSALTGIWPERTAAN
ncbi:hypothetical protein OH77DRAFT_897834 [Trametes cingulata]|nr:hypothetical protein OH77DRAFT_897834 [Trametes cingulata]